MAGSPGPNSGVTAAAVPLQSVDSKIWYNIEHESLSRPGDGVPALAHVTTPNVAGHTQKHQMYQFCIIQYSN